MREELKSKKKKKEGWEGKGTGVGWGGGGKERMDIVSSTGSARARVFIVTSLNRSKVSLSLHNEQLC